MFVQISVRFSDLIQAMCERWRGSSDIGVVSVALVFRTGTGYVIDTWPRRLFRQVYPTQTTHVSHVTYISYYFLKISLDGWTFLSRGGRQLMIFTLI